MKKSHCFVKAESIFGIIRKTREPKDDTEAKYSHLNLLISGDRPEDETNWRTYKAGEFYLASCHFFGKRQIVDEPHVRLLIHLLQASPVLRGAVSQLVDNAFNLGKRYSSGELKLRKPPKIKR